MKKLLLASLSVAFVFISCKTKKTNTDATPTTDSIWEAPTPASENPAKYDSLKQELNKRRKEKQNK